MCRFDKGKTRTAGLLAIIAVRSAAECHPEPRRRRGTSQSQIDVREAKDSPRRRVVERFPFRDGVTLRWEVPRRLRARDDRHQRSVPLITSVISPFAGCAS